MTVDTAEQLRRLAVGTLERNWRGTHTVPSRALYPHQWSWDAGFIAVGLAHEAPQRAWQDLRTLFQAQWTDGRVPHIVFDAGDVEREYFPGPRFWRTTSAPGASAWPTSGIVQPPVHAIAAWELYRRAREPADRSRAIAELTALYPRLVGQQSYLTVCRDVGGAGLVAIVHPWESGQDNSPAWDAALAAVPTDAAPMDNYLRRDLAVSAASHRPTDGDYSRYITIAQGYRSYAYVDDGPGARYRFLVECPAFNAITAAAEHALARIAEVLGRDPAPHRQEAARLTAALVNRLFDPHTGMFHARDLYADRLSPAHCIGGLVPLILPELPRAQVEALVAQACSPRFGLADDSELPLPSYDRTAPDLDPVRYWRGPIWVNMNWLIWRGLRQHGYHELAQVLRERLLELVRRSGCYEYFHALTGHGVGAADFSWTAALTLDLLADPAPV